MCKYQWTIITLLFIATRLATMNIQRGQNLWKKVYVAENVLHPETNQAHKSPTACVTFGLKVFPLSK